MQGLRTGEWFAVYGLRGLLTGGSREYGERERENYMYTHIDIHIYYRGYIWRWVCQSELMCFYSQSRAVVQESCIQKAAGLGLEFS